MLMMLKDRVEGGKRLADRILETEDLDGVVVLGLPRGGVVTAFEVAKVLDAPMDVVVTRKVGAPGQPELAVAALTSNGTVLYNEKLMEKLGIGIGDIEDTVAQEKKEARRRLDLFRGDRPPLDLEDKTVILVDDGIATGYTIKAALMSLRLSGAKRIIIAVPVLPPDTLMSLQELVDGIHYILMPEVFYSISQFYESFPEVKDAEVIALMDKSKKL